MGYTVPPMPTHGQKNSALMDILELADHVIAEKKVMELGPLAPLRPHELSSGRHIPLLICCYCHTPRVDATRCCASCGAWETEMEGTKKSAPPPRPRPRPKSLFSLVWR